MLLWQAATSLFRGAVALLLPKLFRVLDAALKDLARFAAADGKERGALSQPHQRWVGEQELMGAGSTVRGLGKLKHGLASWFGEKQDEHVQQKEARSCCCSGC